MRRRFLRPSTTKNHLQTKQLVRSTRNSNRVAAYALWKEQAGQGHQPRLSRCVQPVCLHRMCQTLDWGICNARLVQCVDFWGLPTSFSHTLDSLGRWPSQPVCFWAQRLPLCWNFSYHSQIVLSVGGSVWCLFQNLHYTITTDSVLANFKTQNAFLSFVLAMFHQDCPLVVKPASMPWRLLHKETWKDSLPTDTLLSVVSVLVAALQSSKFLEGLMNYPVFK
jgi:hypothetical protein